MLCQITALMARAEMRESRFEDRRKPGARSGERGADVECPMSEVVRIRRLACEPDSGQRMAGSDCPPVFAVYNI